MAEGTITRRDRLEIWWSVYVEQRLQACGSKSFPNYRWWERAVRWCGRALYLARRYIAGARDVETVDIGETAGSIVGDGIAIHWGGACPVQGHGTVDGFACYYRSRGEGWQFHVAATEDDIFEADVFTYEQRGYFWPDGGWVASSVTERCILEAVAKFRLWRAEESQRLLSAEAVHGG